jgi:hypothetical protein
MMVVKGTEHEQEDEHDHEALLGPREDKEVQEAFHFAA